MMPKSWVWSLPVVLGVLAPSSAVSAALDGSAPFLCAIVQALECSPDGTCERRGAEDINLPQFIKIDPKTRVIAAPEPGGRTAPVQDLASVDGKLVMHGGQQGRGWSAVIVSDTGKMSVSIVDEGATFVVFGACTAP
jgi:hypothetical protein